MSWRLDIPEAANEAEAEAAAHANRVLAQCNRPSERRCGLSHPPLGARDQNDTVKYKDVHLNAKCDGKNQGGKTTTK